MGALNNPHQRKKKHTTKSLRPKKKKKRENREKRERKERKCEIKKSNSQNLSNAYRIKIHNPNYRIEPCILTRISFFAGLVVPQHPFMLQRMLRNIQRICFTFCLLLSQLHTFIEKSEGSGVMIWEWPWFSVCSLSLLERVDSHWMETFSTPTEEWQCHIYEKVLVYWGDNALQKAIWLMCGLGERGVFLSFTFCKFACFCGLECHSVLRKQNKTQKDFLDSWIELNWKASN